MRDIFSGASSVIVWLSPTADESDKVLKLIGTLRLYLTLNPLEKQVLSTTSPGSGYWRAYFHLISRPYWRRLWIIQELVMARELTIYCGSMTLS
jgi:hypothetical protein